MLRSLRLRLAQWLAGDELMEQQRSFERARDDIERAGRTQMKELLAEKSKTEGVIFASDDGVILTDPQGQAQLLNPKAREILGVMDESLDQLSGRPIWSFVKDDRLAIILRQLVEDPVSEAREVDLSAEGVRRAFAVGASRIQPSDGSDSSVWVVVRLRNITAEKELNQLKDDFLQSLTHDLRSPMTALRGYMQILAEEMAGPVTEEQKKILHVMEMSSTKLLHIISNLLDTAKMSAGKLRVNLSTCDLRRMVPNTVELYHSEAAKKNITLTVDLPETIAPFRADPGLLERVLINLLSNAIKFTPEGGFVTVKFTELSDRIQGQVIDTGVGLPAEFMSRIFKKFEQAPGTRGGTGLGLAICKFIIDAHYGEISVKSKSGEGTTFTFILPKYLEQNEKGDVFLVKHATAK